MRAYSVSDVIRALAKNVWTAMIVDDSGRIAALIASDVWPSPEFVLSLNNDYPNTVCKLLPQNSYSASSIEAILKSIRETFEMRNQGLLGPGMTTL